MYTENLKRDLTELGLEVNQITPEGLRDSLVARLASLHPDKTGGKFHNEEQENSFRKIKGLLERLDSETSISSQLIPINHIVTLVDVLTKLRSSDKVSSELTERKVSDGSKQYLKRKYALPKITSAVVAGLCFMLFSLLGSFRQNPLYRAVLDLYVQDPKADVRAWMQVQTHDLGEQLLELSDRVEFANREIVLLQRHLPENFHADFLTYERDLGDVVFESRYDKYRTTRKSNDTNVNDDSKSGNDHQPPYVNLFETTEPAFLVGLKTNSAQLTKDLSSTINKLASIRPKNGSTEVPTKELLTSFLTRTQNRVTVLDNDIKSAETQLVIEKNAAINRADASIMKRLAGLTLTVVFIFIWIWVRERSDQSWLDFLSTDDGVETVLTRLCANEEVMKRVPPRFSRSELSHIVARKDVPTILSPILGSRLDAKHLGQITSFLIDRLKGNDVISERKESPLQIWFEVSVETEMASVD